MDKPNKKGSNPSLVLITRQVYHAGILDKSRICGCGELAYEHTVGYCEAYRSGTVDELSGG